MRMLAMVCALAILGAGTARADGVVIERTVAVVNGAPVFESDLDHATLDDLIRQAVVLAEAPRMMLTVDDADIDAVIEEIKQANGIDDAALATALAEQKWTMRRYRRELRRQVLMLKVRNVIVSQELRGVPSEEWAARADEVFGRWIEDRVAHAHIVKRDAE